jgi:methyl-accepting chemotaxis protein
MMMSAIWLQDPDSISSGNSRLLMFFVGMVAFSMLTQAIVFIAAAVAAAKARNRLIAIAEEIRLKTIPVIDNTLNMVEDLRPKLKVMTDNFVEASHIVRAKAQEFDSTVTDVNQKTRAQAARVDDMVTSVLNTTTNIASTIQKGVQVPVTQFSGLMNGLKAGLETLFGNGKRPRHPNHDATKPFGYGVKDDDIGL